jgi:tetratricopeptide (TPR) repeat protein
MKWQSPLCLLLFIASWAHAQQLTTPNGWVYEVLKPGSGPLLTAQDGALAHNQLTDSQGKVLVSTYKIGVPDYQLISDLSHAFQQAFAVMQSGGKYRFHIPVSDFRDALRSNADLSLPGKVAFWDMELLQILPPLPDGARLVAQVMQQSGPEAALARYQSLQRSAEAYFGEWEINQVGYLFLQKGQAAEALEIFKGNAMQHSGSFNAHDSLAEAYYTLGNKAMALEHYEKSLRLNPQNDNARAMLAKLRD